MAITLDITNPATQVTINTAAVPTSTANASNVAFTSYGNLTATTVEEAIQQLADNAFSQATAPTTNLNEGDTWYNTSTEQLYVYRETSTGVFEWVPILLGAAGGDSDTLDAGAF